MFGKIFGGWRKSNDTEIQTRMSTQIPVSNPNNFQKFEPYIPKSHLLRNEPIPMKYEEFPYNITPEDEKYLNAPPETISFNRIREGRKKPNNKDNNKVDEPKRNYQQKSETPVFEETKHFYDERFNPFPGYNYNGNSNYNPNNNNNNDNQQNKGYNNFRGEDHKFRYESFKNEQQPQNKYGVSFVQNNNNFIDEMNKNSNNSSNRAPSDNNMSDYNNKYNRENVPNQNVFPQQHEPFKTEPHLSQMNHEQLYQYFSNHDKNNGNIPPRFPENDQNIIQNNDLSHAQNYYPNNPQNNYPNNPQNNYPNNPQNNYPNNPQNNYPNNPQNNYPNNPQNNYSNNPQNNYSNNPQNNYPNNSQNNYQCRDPSYFESHIPTDYPNKAYVNSVLDHSDSNHNTNQNMNQNQMSNFQPDISNSKLDIIPDNVPQVVFNNNVPPSSVSKSHQTPFKNSNPIPNNGKDSMSIYQTYFQRNEMQHDDNNVINYDFFPNARENSDNTSILRPINGNSAIESKFTGSKSRMGLNFHRDDKEKDKEDDRFFQQYLNHDANNEPWHTPVPNNKYKNNASPNFHSISKRSLNKDNFDEEESLNHIHKTPNPF
ncbi:hypothetical protein TRFO_30838 [Tritrichomonas foetus]|uniref:Uncharacterized protein n=1 Tax=Tritrichomonas foetus TaxID=1144522 RepID=A0A1J4JY23_9EUKA|nr:hypothetical protein TRFO_30838 [Tritrichomonas foetus]|eukprot:OHT02173.1 hypothetical protein TRFO_30838 [Tritrichomonas foetus]